jgi:DNA replication and repair protein RecF
VREALSKGRQRDIALRSTESGPHRDDFAVFASGLDLRSFGSQGQQRTAALSLRLAEREMIRKATGEEAILLLDDVLSELDAGRQERLLCSFGECQIFITAAGAFREAAERLKAAKVIRVEAGRIV